MSAAERLWRSAARCAPDFAVLAQPRRNAVRLVQASGTLADRYAEMVIADRLENLISREQGVPHIYRGQETIGRNVERQRVYAKYVFSPEHRATNSASERPGGLALFVKRGRGVSWPEMERFLAGLRDKHFCAPKFLWHLRAAGVRVGVWEFVDGRSSQFTEAEPGDIGRVIEAVAGINAVSDHAVSGLGLPSRMPHVHPLAQRVAAVIRTARWGEGSAGRDAVADLDRFARVEARLIARYHDLPHRCLTHNDIKPANLLVRTGDGRIVATDWNSARIGVPGASLRFLAAWSAPARTELAEHYVESMRRLGLRLALGDVLFAIEATHVFRTLGNAARSADPPQLRGALSAAARLADSR